MDNGYLTDVAEQVNDRREVMLPYAVFGYSLGSILAYDLLARKMVVGSPLHAFICAKGSPFYEPQSYEYADYPDEFFIRDIVSLGGINEKLLADKRFLTAFIKPICADYIAWGGYHYHGGKIPCNVTAIYSENDESATDVAEWALVVEKKIEFFTMGNNHFFINEHWQDVANIINQHLSINLDSTT